MAAVWKVTKAFLAYWFGFSAAFTLLSLAIWDVVFVHIAVGLGLVVATPFVFINWWGQKSKTNTQQTTASGTDRDNAPE